MAPEDQLLPPSLLLVLLVPVLLVSLLLSTRVDGEEVLDGKKNPVLAVLSYLLISKC